MSPFPARDDGPQGRTWNPAIPHCGAGTLNGKAFKFAVKTEDGNVHRFLLTRKDALWLGLSLIGALFPHLSRAVLPRRFPAYTAKPLSQWLKSSGMPSSDGSPHEGQAL